MLRCYALNLGLRRHTAMPLRRGVSFCLLTLLIIQLCLALYHLKVSFACTKGTHAQCRLFFELLFLLCALAVIYFVLVVTVVHSLHPNEIGPIPEVKKYG